MFLYHHLNNLPEFFKDYFVTNNQIHQYNTRNASKLHKCYKRTIYVEHTLSITFIRESVFYINCSFLWNLLELYTYKFLQHFQKAN